jgi:hypothetical protein
VNRWIRLLYPSEFARRHGDEIAALLQSSPQPVRDHLDVVIHAIRLRSEQIMSRLPRYVADLAIAWAIFLLGFVVNDLEHGLGDLPRHWWSTAAALLVIVTCAVRAAVTVIDRRRTDRAQRTPPWTR